MLLLCVVTDAARVVPDIVNIVDVVAVDVDSG